GAAELAEAAAAQGKFWEAHHAIFAWSRKHGPESFGTEAFLAIARSVQLDAVAVRDAIDDHRYLERIRSDFTSGVRSGVNGTPTFFIAARRHAAPSDEDTLSRALAETER